MLENNFLFLTIALLIILTAVFVGYMRGRVDSRDYVFHKLRYLIYVCISENGDFDRHRHCRYGIFLPE